MKQLSCPACDTTDLKDSFIVESNVQLNNVIVRNPAKGRLIVRLSHPVYDEAVTYLVCKMCGAESPLSNVDYNLAK